jgi:heat-inducible transcriptional repressor
LQVIVSDYVSTAVPVASSTVVRSSGLNVSAATVRSEMVVLEDVGYILRPHVSAGGVPSSKGYRYFVDNLGPQDVIAVDSAAVQAGLQQSRRDFEAWARSAASALASLLGTLAFATPPRAAAVEVRNIELLRIQDLLVMLVVILNEASVHRELINVDRSLAGEELETERNRLAELLRGKNASQVQAAAHGAPGGLAQKVLESTARAMRQHDEVPAGDTVFQGLGRLLSQPELTSRPEQARVLVQAIEDDGIVAEIAARAPEDGEPAVIIGPELELEPLREYSVVVSRYGAVDSMHGVVGLVGPTRMHYARAIPAVRSTATALGDMAHQVIAG